MNDLATALGRQRIEELRSIAERTPPGQVWLPGPSAMSLAQGVNEAYIALPVREFLALLDRIPETPAIPDDTQSR